ncbi:diaminopimelate decarboxylase [Nakamurella endophytica]|uniref:Diaminopimelate decarboxylase n=1 Tax=Nakamurella endophytica TaxID=1748367 RepID=A0A917TDC8_9ACTN|nr:diaminopimelate decarboxylase [Nakamurella endophytica]GGM18154.1 diaminopimelate decarboxylase [Nakamurella endophytica]
MRAHPAGPRHGEIPAAHLDAPAGDLNLLDRKVWPRTATRTGDGALAVGGVDVRDLAATHGTPFFVLDEADFRSRCQDFADAFGDAGQVHYAGKAFLCREVVRWLDQERLSLDVCSGGELALALSAGFPADRIALHGSNKSTAELRAAVDAGIGAVVVDSFDEIGRLAGIVERRADRAEPHTGNGGVPAGRRPVPVMIRVTVGVEAHTHEFIATAHEDQKFGFSLASGAATEAVRRVLAADGLRLVGLHSHIGSQIFDPAGFELAAGRLVRFLTEILERHPELADVLRTLDLGGGLGIAYTSADDPPPVDTMAKSLSEIVTRECQLAGLPVPAIAVEPGRAIAGPGTVTVYEVGTIKDVELGGGLARRYVSVDGGMSDNIRTALYDADYTVVLASRESSAPAVRSRVVGKHCESGDIVVRDCYLPADLAVGDLVAVAATGAYCYAMASTYNRVPRPPVLSVADGAGRVLLRRETYDDLMRLEMP